MAVLELAQRSIACMSWRGTFLARTISLLIYCFHISVYISLSLWYQGIFTRTRDSKLPRENNDRDSSSYDHCELIWIPLVLTQIVTGNEFETRLTIACAFWHFIVKFILNINNEQAQDYSCPGATFAFCSHGEKLPRQGSYTVLFNG